MERERATVASARVRRPPVALLATVLAVLLVPVAAHAQAPRTVPSELDALLAAGAIDQLHHDAWAESYDNAKATLKKLHGTRRRQLDAVIANTRAIAKAGLLTPTPRPARLPDAAAQPRLVVGGAAAALRPARDVRGQPARVAVLPRAGDPGPVAGHLRPRPTGSSSRRGRDDELRALLDEALGLATARAGGIAWESLFHFDGGAPPWVSGLSQGTALQALSRAAARLGEPRYFEAARAALGIFRTAPPEGVRVDTPVGAHYLQYSFAPGLHIINGFVQALNGLYDFAAFANDAEGRALFAAGEAQARVELPTFDTGAWSLYQPGKESDLGYHELVRDFLRALCKRVPDPALYCTEADRFTAYLRQPPVLALKSTFALARKPSKLVFTLNKVSTVTLTVLRKGKPGAHALGALRLRPPRLRLPPAPARRARGAPARGRPRRATSAPSPGGSRCGRAE